MQCRKDLKYEVFSMSTEYTKEQAHGELDRIFCELLPRKGLYQRDEQIKLSHFMLDAMLDSRIALCDAGTGIGKTYAYLVAGILYFHYRKKNGMYKKPIVISTSSIALQNAVMQEYLPLLSEVLLEGKMIHAPVRAVIRKGKQALCLRLPSGTAYAGNCPHALLPPPAGSAVVTERGYRYGSCKTLE